MTVCDCLKPLTRSAVGNDDRMLRKKFVVVCKCPGGRDTINSQMPAPTGLIVKQMPGVCSGGGMLAVGIDSHIINKHFFLQRLGNILAKRLESTLRGLVSKTMYLDCSYSLPPC